SLEGGALQACFPVGTLTPAVVESPGEVALRRWIHVLVTQQEKRRVSVAFAEQFHAQQLQGLEGACGAASLGLCHGLLFLGLLAFTGSPRSNRPRSSARASADG